MDTKALAQAYHRDGYAIARGVFTPAEVAEMERNLAEFIKNVVPTMKAGDVYYEDTGDGSIKSIFRLHAHREFFNRLMEDERLLSIVRAVFPGTEITRVGAFFFGKAARSGSVTPPHQDNAFQNRHPPEELIATIAIDESTPENGALTVQRGSHHLGLLPHRPSGVMGFSQTLITPLDKEKYPEVQLCLKPGDVCLHHTNTIHGSGANRTDRSRRTLAMSYHTTRALRDEEGWKRYRAEVDKLHKEKAHA